MTLVSENIKLVCVVYGDEELTYYKLELRDELNNAITTLEYADITKQFNDLLELNKEANLYINEAELKKELAQGKLNKYVGKTAYTQRLLVLVDLLVKIKHQSGQCENNCHICNPNIENDAYLDFTFGIKSSLIQGYIIAYSLSLKHLYRLW